MAWKTGAAHQGRCISRERIRHRDPADREPSRIRFADSARDTMGRLLSAYQEFPGIHPPGHIDGGARFVGGESRRRLFPVYERLAFITGGGEDTASPTKKRRRPWES